MTPLTVAVWNFQDFGWDKQTRTFARLPLLPEVIKLMSAPPDILAMQEVWRGPAEGSWLLFEAERLLERFGNGRGYLRAFYFPPPPGRESQLGEVIFLRWPMLQPIHQYIHGASDVFDEQAGWLHVRITDLDLVIKVRSIQWEHSSGDRRLHAAAKLTGHAADRTLILGDANSLWPGRREFEPHWHQRPCHKRQHKTLPPGADHARLLDRARTLWHRLLGDPLWRPLRSDRRALTLLAEAGYVNAGVLAGDYTVTVNHHIDDGQGARIDHILGGAGIAPAFIPGSYQVYRHPIIDQAGDHRPLSVQIDLDRLAAIAATPAKIPHPSPAAHMR